MGYEEREMKLTAMTALLMSVNDANISTLIHRVPHAIYFLLCVEIICGLGRMCLPQRATSHLQFAAQVSVDP